MGIQKSAEARRPMRFLGGQIEFPTTIEADAVSAVLNGEHTAHVFVAAAKQKLEGPEQPVH